MSKQYAALALAVTLTLGGVSLASASPGEPAQGRQAPTAPDPAKPLTRVSESPAGGNPGDVPEGIAGGYVFVPISPYRTIDSRDYADGYLLPGEAVYFDVLVNQTNVPMIPPEAVAVTFNLTATNTTGGGGFLAVFPADIDWPGNSNVNWSFDGTTIANSGTVKLGHYDAPGQITVAHGPANRSGGVDFVVDITGYYI